MKIHTNTPFAWRTAYDALNAAKDAGKIASHVDLDICTSQGSRSHSSGAVVHLATYNGGPGTDHPYRTNSGRYGANSEDDGYAATYAEWGWFFVELFRIDPTARAGHYKNRDDFYAQTDSRASYTKGDPRYPSFRTPALSASV